VPVLIAQSLVFAAAATRLAIALARSGLRGPWPWAAVLLLGASPSLVGWSRSLLTETLSAALAIWLLAELILSWHERRLRIVPIAVVFCAGLFLRYDFVLLALPVAAAGFLIHPPAEALRRGTAIALIVALPLGAWAVRSVSQGLSVLPPFGLTPEGDTLPKGMMAWIGTWIDDQYQLQRTVWQLVHYDYDRFSPPERAYRDQAEKARIEALLAKLRTDYQGQPPPSAIDADFAAEAALRRAEQPMQRWFFLPLRRNAHMWLSPYPSMGWPVEIATAERAAFIDNVRKRDWPALVDAMGRNAGAVAAKAIVALDRYALAASAIILLIAAWRLQHRLLVFLAAIVLVGLVGRFLLSGYLPLVETRYLVPLLAWLNVALLVVIMALLQRRA